MGLFDFLFSKNKHNSNPEDTGVKNEALLNNVEIKPGLLVPSAFAKHWSEIEKTKLPFISIEASPQSDIALEDSKFGYYPVMPADFEYPTDTEGKPMYPLAQINCKQMPRLAGYPETGYLQFYISGNDDVYGLDFDAPDSQANFRVLYFEDDQINNLKDDFSFLDDVMQSDVLPVYKPHKLTFELKQEYIGIGDVRYENQPIIDLSAITKQYPDIEEILEEKLYDIKEFSGSGHKIGGYAYFTQEDPRSYNDRYSDYILLLQIDTDDEIMWGDSGVANFFIHPLDLAKKDFSKVMYNWDCC